MAIAVGIDLGTTNTVVAAVRNGVVGTVPDPDGARLIPSVVSFHPSGSVVVGRDALERRLIDAPNTIYSVKRLIGRAWGSPLVEQARGKVSFDLREGPGGGTVVVARGEKYSLPEISAFVLRQAKAVAEAALGSPVERAVITVPASFNDLQRAATKTAGRLAGLEVLRILNEPTAAALAYGPRSNAQERIAVYDLGGGTFDVTLLDLAGNVFEVLATSGDTALGGDDIDTVIADRMADDLLAKHRLDARAHPQVYGRLRILAEDMKRALSARDDHTLNVDDLVPGIRGATERWTFRMTRPELEWASLALIERTFQVCQQAFDASGASARKVDRVLLVGGATRMPLVARKVEQFFGRAPVVRINPDEVVALGAAIQAALLDRARERSAGPGAHPRIAEESVMARLPLDDVPAMEDLAGLPIVIAPVKGAPVPPLRPGPPPLPPPAPFPAPAASSPAAAPFAAPAAPPAAAPFAAPAPPAAAPFAAPPAPPAAAPFAAPAPPAAAPSPVPPPAAPPVPPPAPSPPVAKAAAEPAPKRTEFLPGREAKPLVFDVPLSEPPPPPPRPQGVPDLPPEPRRAVQPAVPPAPAPRAPVIPRPPSPLLIDVTPLSLGVETVGGFCDILIEANTPVPCDRVRSFATASAGQTAVHVRVSQGASGRFAENTFLGELELSGLAPAPRGETQIAVTFEIDADGILNVRARDVKTGTETAARIQLVGAQSEPREIEAMNARQAAHPLAGIRGLR